MSEAPKDMAAFLAAAEKLLREKVLSETKGEARFAGLMSASAVGMASREIALAPKVAAARQTIAGLTPQAIRRGRFDGDAAAYRDLLADAAVRTAVTRPQALTEAERKAAGVE